MSDTALTLNVTLSEADRAFLLIACGDITDDSTRSRPGAGELTAQGVLDLRGRLKAAEVTIEQVIENDPSDAGWSWWASTDEENFTVGPCATREQVIEAGRQDFDGKAFFIVEATKPDKRCLMPSAERIISDALEAAADDGQFGEDGDYDLLGKPEDVEKAFAELNAALAAWADRWESILPKPWKFQDTGNFEAIEGGEACGICEELFVDGDACLTDISLGPVHARCCGPERESYVNLETGEPLADDAFIPTPWIWNADGTISSGAEVKPCHCVTSGNGAEGCGLCNETGEVAA